MSNCLYISGKELSKKLINIQEKYRIVKYYWMVAMEKETITFNKNIQEARNLFIRAGQALNKRGFVNAKY